jgi:hypothetical protein
VCLRKPEIAFVFRLQPGLENLSGVFLLSQEFFNTGDSAVRSCSASGDGLVGAIKIVPGQGLHIRPKHEVSVAFPDFQLVLLCRIYRAADDLKNVSWGAAMAVLHSDGNAENDGCAEFARGARWNWRDEPSVCQAAGTDLHWLEQARESATRTDGVHEIALREHHRIARSQVRGDDRKGDAKILELTRVEDTCDQVLKTLVARQAETGNAPAGNIPELQGAASLNNASQGRPAGVCSAEDTAHAGSRDVRDGDLVLLEHLQHAKMCETSCKTTAQGKADPCPRGHRGCTIVQGVAWSVPVPRHNRSFSAGTFSTYGSGVLI